MAKNSTRTQSRTERAIWSHQSSVTLAEINTEDNFKSNLINMIEAFKEKMNKFHTQRKMTNRCQK